MKNENEIRAKLIVLETLCKATLGLVFALTASSDPDHQKAITTLDAIKATTKWRLSETTSEAETLQAGATYLDELLSELSETFG